MATPMQDGSVAAAVSGTPQGSTRVDPAPAARRSPLEQLFDGQRAAFEGERYPDIAIRQDRLRRLLHVLTDDEQGWIDAIARDFGHRSAHETRLAEIFVVASAIRQAQHYLERWMRRRAVGTPMHLWPARSLLLRQPVGVVGVISPWNYPLQLALGPALAALAAGNRVLLKPSELTPTVAALLAERVHASFRADEFAVVEGDASVGRAFAALPFDHLFFTGSTAVGRMIARAAAENLTPVTLELGGKSPALIDHDADLRLAADRIVVGKLLNAGQTCIAPDYVMVEAGRRDAFVDATLASIQRHYPDLAEADYSSIVDERHYRRLQGLVDDARAKGAHIVTAGGEALAPRKLAPTLVVGADESMAVMQEEIFGPVLPVETYERLDDAIERINRRPRPLAFYYFGDDHHRRARVLDQTIAGGVTVNDTVLHFVHEDLPFGGIGASGTGVYHGEHGFLTFSHEKPVLVQARRTFTGLLHPPYGRTFERVLGMLRKLAT